MQIKSRQVGGCCNKKGVAGNEIPLGALDLRTPPPGALQRKVNVATKPSIEKPSAESHAEVLEIEPELENDYHLDGLGFRGINEVRPKAELFQLPGELGLWLGKMERFRNVIIVHGERGGGKSNLVYDLMNGFAEMHWVKRIGFFSLEEGADTDLVKRKRDKYFGQNANQKVAITDQAPNGVADVDRAAQMMDVIVVDSFGKLNAPQTALDTLRTKHPSKIFIFVFQTTTAGNARGGSAAAFDCAVEIIVKKDSYGNFKKNYGYLEKNRYAATGTMYNVYNRTRVEETA